MNQWMKKGKQEKVKGMKKGKKEKNGWVRWLIRMKVYDLIRERERDRQKEREREWEGGRENSMRASIQRNRENWEESDQE